MQKSAPLSQDLILLQVHDKNLKKLNHLNILKLISTVVVYE